MNPRFSFIVAALALFGGAPSAAQVGLGQVSVPGVGQVLDPLLDPALRDVDGLTRDVVREVERLADDRLDRIDRLVRRNRDTIERDRFGEPARRGELLVMDADPADIAQAQQAGYAVIERSRIDSLSLTVTRLSLPRGTSLEEGAEELESMLPGATISADNLYFQSGSAGVTAVGQAAFARAQTATRVPVGMIDGAPGPESGVASTRGFAAGAPNPSDHASAIASLMRGAGITTIRAADVYGTDSAGGNAAAIARALGWLVEQGSRVVVISLVGPDNPVMERAIAAARREGVIVVAAVGNDGPAAPPAYPASYNGVIAVTAVDRRERALIEAGRASHLDYAAPGADIYGLDAGGRSRRLRGTSFATPLVAARLAAALESGAGWRATLDREAEDLGERGPDPVFGRGLLCRGCGARD